MADLTVFAGRMRGKATLIRANSGGAVKVATRAIFEQLVKSTPVDTGLAISNWAVGIDRKPLSYRFVPYDPGEKGSTRSQNEDRAIAEAEKVIKRFRVDRDVDTGRFITKAQRNSAMVITNYLPYINRLNEGYSPQAAAGWIQRAVARGGQAVRDFKILEQTIARDTSGKFARMSGEG